VSVAGAKRGLVRRALNPLFPDADREAPFGGDRLLARFLAFLRGGEGAQWLARTWSEAATLAGLSDVLVLSSAFDLEMALSARSGGLRVEVRTNRSSREGQIAVAIDGLRHRPGELGLRAESLGTTVSKVVGARELITGDSAFDDGVYVQGWPPLVHALFDAETRRVVLRFLQGRIDIPGSAIGRSLRGRATVADGQLRVEMPDPGRVPPAYLADTLSGLLNVARRLVRPADIPGRLAWNLGREPLPEVRLRGLEALIRYDPDQPATLKALGSALGDSSADVQILAAKALGTEGHETLLSIVSSDQCPEGAQEEALRALGPRLSTATGVDVLRRALRRRRLRLAERCVEALGRARSVEAVAPLGSVLAIEGGTLAPAAARALGATGRPEAEAPLLSALAHPDDRVREAAAVALGQCGTAAGVAPLRRVEATSRNAGCRRAAREAVAQIQSRLTGADPGQLSLAEGESGQLSLAEDERGRVSLPGDGPDTRPKTW
jgi:HEAT repeat protein